MKSKQVTVIVILSCLISFKDASRYDDPFFDDYEDNYIDDDEIREKSVQEPRQKGEERGGNHEGDMILTRQQERMIEDDSRTGLMHPNFRWPKNQRGQVIVPYSFRNKRDFCKFLSRLFYFNFLNNFQPKNNETYFEKHLTRSRV